MRRTFAQCREHLQGENKREESERERQAGRPAHYEVRKLAANDWDSARVRSGPTEPLAAELRNSGGCML